MDHWVQVSPEKKELENRPKIVYTITDMLGVVYYHVEFPDKIYTNKQLTERVSTHY